MKETRHLFAQYQSDRMMPSNGVLFTVFTRGYHINTPFCRIHDILSQIYVKGQSSQVLTCLQTFSEMAEPVQDQK